MKIMHLAESLGIGGLANYVLSVVKLQKKLGHEVCVGYTKDTPWKQLETSGIEFVHVPTFDSLKSLEVDVVNIHLLDDIDYLSALDAQNEIVVTRFFHEYTSTCLRRGKRRFPGDRCHRPLNYGCAAFGCLIGPPLDRTKSRLPRLINLPQKIKERDLYREFDAAICGSNHMKNMLVVNGFEVEKIHHLPYFSNFENEADNPTNKADGAGVSRPVKLLFSGQAVKGKGLEVLIEALGMLKKTNSWHLTVFCEGPRLEPAKELARKLDISKKITFNGWVEHSVLLDSYKNADLFILPSIWDEPGGLVGLEALSCGTPVVGFAVGGIPDYVIDGETGFLVRDVNAKGLCKGIERAFEAPEQIVELSANCKSHVKANQTSARHIEGMIQVYKTSLDNRV